MGFQSDYAWGKEQETLVFNILKPIVGPSLEHIEQFNSPYDFRDSKYWYEVKARRCSYRQYPTTLLPYNKCISGDSIFIFVFTDGIYFIRYDMELFNTFDVAPFSRGKRADFNDKPQLYYYIPISKLLPIREFTYE